MPAKSSKPTTSLSARCRSDHARHHRKRAAQRAHRDGRRAVPHGHVPRNPRAARCISDDRQSGRQDGRRPVRLVHEGFIAATTAPSRKATYSSPTIRILRWRDQPPQRLAADDADLPRRPAGRLGRDVRPHDRCRRKGAGLAADRRQEIYEEGIIVPPVKIYKNGVLKMSAHVMLSNCRLPHWNRSDFNAIVAALRLAERRVLENIARFGIDIYISAMWEMLDRNKRAMSAIIQMIIPESKQGVLRRFHRRRRNRQGPLQNRLHDVARRRESDLRFQRNRSAIALVDQFSPERGDVQDVPRRLHHQAVRSADSVQRRLLRSDRSTDPGRLLLKPHKPAALSCRTHMLGRIFDISAACSAREPDSLNAAGFSDSPHFMYSGYNDKGEWYQLYQIGFGGIPGRPSATVPTDIRCGQPSPTCRTNSSKPISRCALSNTRPSRTPAAPGKHRGGNGVTIGYEMLEPGEISIHDDRWLTYPWGVNGGLPGGRSTRSWSRQWNGAAENIAVEVRPHQSRARRHPLFRHLGRRRLGRSFNASCRTSPKTSNAAW